MKCTVSFFTLILSAGMALAENMVFNGDFELGTGGFTIERHQRIDTNASVDFVPLKEERNDVLSGKLALRVENPYAERGFLYSKEFFLKPDTKYFLRGGIKASVEKLPVRVDLINRTMAKGVHSVIRTVYAGKNWSRFEIPLDTEKFGGMYHIKFSLPAREATVWLDRISVSSQKDDRFAGIEMSIAADDRIYVAPEKKNARIAVRVYNSSPTLFQKKIRLVAVDDYFADRSPVAELSCRIAPGKIQTFEFLFPLKRMGCFQIEPEKPDGIRFFPAYFAVVGTVEKKPFDRNSFCVGFNGGLGVKGMIDDPPGLVAANASVREKLRILSLAGCRILRGHDCGDLWYYLEPEQGKFNFQLFDFGLKLFEEAGIAYMPIVGGNAFYIETAPWASKKYPLWFEQVARKGKTVSKGHPMLIPPDPVWRRYVRNLAAHAGKRIMQYEIFNEAQFQLSPESYLQFLKSAYEEIKKANPEAAVVGFCSTSDKGEDIGLFARRCFELGGLKFADAVSFHPYASRELGSVEPADKQIASMKSLIRRNGENTPVWNTELYYLFDGPEMANYWESGNVEAHHVAWRFLTDLGEGVEQSVPLSEDQLWKELMIPGYEHITSYPEYYPSSIIPACNALTRFFEGATPLRKLRYPEGMICYVFRKDGVPVAALWNYRKVKNLKINLEGFRAYDLFGNPLRAGMVEAGIPPFYLKAENEKEAEFIRRLENLPILQEQAVAASPEARLLKNGTRPELLVSLHNQIRKTVSGYVGIGDAAFSALAPQPFTLKAGASETVRIPLQESGNAATAELRIYTDGKIWKQNLKIRPVPVHPFSKPFTMKSPDGVLQAEGAFSRSGTEIVLEIRVRDTSDSGEAGKRPFWEQDCIELFLDPAPARLDRHHPSAYYPGICRLFVMPRWKQPARLAVWKNAAGLSEKNIRCSVENRPDGYRVRLVLPASALPENEFGCEIKINDAEGRKKTVREAYLFGAKQAYRDRLEFGIIRKEQKQ